MKLLLLTSAGTALGSTAGVSSGANPIRKVVNMLNMMSEKVEAEGKREEELFEKYQCYCETNEAEVSKSIETANDRIPQLEATLKESSAVKSQLTTEVQEHKTDRSEGQEALAKATSLREKEHAQFETDLADAATNIKALGNAVKAIESSVAGSAFLQTSTDSLMKIKSLLENSRMVSDNDREVVSSFLSSGKSSDGSSGEIVGILKTIQEETQKDMEEMVATETAREKGLAELVAGKQKEIASMTGMIENKTERIGILAVRVSKADNALERTKRTLGSDSEFLASLREGCNAQEKAWAVRQQTRSQELSAISETIKILNDDDALDLFKKTLPSPETAFIQMHATTRSVQKRALNIIKQLPQTVPISLIQYSLKNKKVNTSKIVTMVDNLLKVLGKEQVDDDRHKAYCEKEFDKSDDKKKTTERNITGLESEKQEAEGDIEALNAEILALKASIIDLDKAVAEAQIQRKAEHAEFMTVTSENSASLNLIEFAKNRLQKFYNPQLHKPEAAASSSEGGDDLGISALMIAAQGRPAPPPPPGGGQDYKKGESSGGVLAMLDMLAQDLRLEMQEAEMEEKQAQKEYEKLMEQSKKKRESDSTAITGKETTKATIDEGIQDTNGSLEEARGALLAVNEAIANLHGSCDFLVENYDARKQARGQEQEGLSKARATLSGASGPQYSLAQQQQQQQQQHGFLLKS